MRAASTPHAHATTPGQPDMWAFVIFECFVFTLYFVIYMLYRMRSPEVFLEGQSHLSQSFGLGNTLILLTSSWMVAECVSSTRAGAYDSAVRQLWTTGLLGVAFVASKISEWALKLADGYNFETSHFFSFYYFLTGVHILHVLIGFGALVILGYQLYGPSRRSQEVIETCATYWHMVDFLWLIIFALLYVVK